MKFVCKRNSNEAVVTLEEDEGDVNVLVNGVMVVYFSGTTLYKAYVSAGDRKKPGIPIDRNGYVKIDMDD